MFRGFMILFLYCEKVDKQLLTIKQYGYEGIYLYYGVGTVL